MGQGKYMHQDTGRLIWIVFIRTVKTRCKSSIGPGLYRCKAAFQYYLEHYNNGRPFIIASHSQGTYHAKRLITGLC